MTTGYGDFYQVANDCKKQKKMKMNGIQHNMPQWLLLYWEHDG